MNTGQIHKSKTNNKFTVIPNCILHDTEMSAKAKGLLCYLLSLPDDWVIYKSEISKHFKEGVDSLRGGWKELENKGYVLSVEVRDGNGRFKGSNYIVYNEPQLKEPTTEKPILDFPISDNPTLLNTNNTKKEKNKEYIIIKGVKIYDFFEYVDHNIGIYLNSIIHKDKDIILNEFFKDNIQKEFSDINHLRAAIRKHIQYRGSSKKSGAINTPIKDYKTNPTYTGKEKEIEDITLKSYNVLIEVYPHNKKLPLIPFVEYHTAIKNILDRYDIETYRKVFNLALDDEFHKVNFTDMKYLERNFEKILNKL